MRESLSNFLVDLAVDPDHLQQFLHDRQSAVDRSSQALTAQEKEALLSGDADRIRSAIGDDKGIPQHSRAIPQHFKKKKGAKKRTPKKKTGRRPGGKKR
jgi:hypothetical protein